MAGEPSSDRLKRLGIVCCLVFGSVLMWSALPLAWLWIGGQVYKATNSFLVYGVVGLAGFAASEWLFMLGLHRLDLRWIANRQLAGHPQREGRLTQIVVVSATFGLMAFFLWYYVVSDGAFVLPFMPTS